MAAVPIATDTLEAEIRRLREVEDAARDLCATVTAKLSPYIGAKCDAIRLALDGLDAERSKQTALGRRSSMDKPSDLTGRIWRKLRGIIRIRV